MKHFRAIAEFYDAENAHHAMLDHDVSFFLGHLPSRKRLRVLEVACGTGRAAIPIAQAGHRVVGIDHAADMLAIARRKRDAAGLTDKQLTLIRQNALSLKLSGIFDWGCIFFNTFLGFATIAQQDSALRGIHRHLVRRGRVWLDVFFPDIERLARPHSRQLEPNLFFVDSLEQAVYRHTEIRPGRASQIQAVTFHYEWFDARGRHRRAKREFDLTWIMPREMEVLLERNGFELEAMYGDYDGSQLGDHSPRMITVARKR
jgi:ubiquinone/menaquinone biosynthesis C-methylase UbiE